MTDGIMTDRTEQYTVYTIYIIHIQMDIYHFTPRVPYYFFCRYVAVYGAEIFLQTDNNKKKPTWTSLPRRISII